MSDHAPHDLDAQAFPVLSSDQIAALEPFGKRKCMAEGQELWSAGTANLCMYVVIEGEMEIVDVGARRQTVVATHGPGSFSGDIDIINGRPALMTGRAKANLEVLEIPGDCVRSIVSERPDLGETILRAFLLRRTILRDSGAFGVLVIGSRYSPESLRIREFLYRSRFPTHWEDVETSPDARKMLDEFDICVDDTPVVMLPKGDILRRPEPSQIAEALGILPEIDGEAFDVVIVGAGPAGLAAAVYGASEGLKTLVLDEEAPGGQAGTSSKIENYMGFPLGISGQDLADRALAQAEKFGARLVAPARTKSLTCGDHGMHDLEVEGMGRIATRCVILAPGARYRKLDVDREDEFVGRGIYYAATQVERLQCGQAPVAVVGAGNSAGQAAVFMAENGNPVHLIVRGDDLRKSMSSYLAVRIENLAREERLTLHLQSNICELRGETSLQEVVIRESKSGTARTEPCEAVFVMIGADPRTGWLNNQSKVALDEKGFVLTGNDVAARGQWNQPGRSPYFLETSCAGVFAVGDVRSGSIKRVASAVGEGSMAIALVHQFLAG